MKTDMAHGFVEFDMGVNVYDEFLTLFTMLHVWKLVLYWHSLSWFIKLCGNDLNV